MININKLLKWWKKPKLSHRIIRNEIIINILPPWDDIFLMNKITTINYQARGMKYKTKGPPADNNDHHWFPNITNFLQKHQKGFTLWVSISPATTTIRKKINPYGKSIFFVIEICQKKNMNTTQFLLLFGVSLIVFSPTHKHNNICSKIGGDSLYLYVLSLFVSHTTKSKY